MKSWEPFEPTWEPYKKKIDLDAVNTELWRQGYAKPTIYREHEAIHVIANTVDNALAAIKAVEALHRPSHDHQADQEPYCLGCYEAGGYEGAPSWPCPTLKTMWEATP